MDLPLLGFQKVGMRFHFNPRAKEPFKGVKELISEDKIAEPLEKGLVREDPFFLELIVVVILMGILYENVNIFF